MHYSKIPPKTFCGQSHITQVEVCWKVNQSWKWQQFEPIMTKTSYFCKLPPEHIIKDPPQGLEEACVNE